MNALVSSGCFNFKLPNPCKKIVKCFKIKLRKPFFMRRLFYYRLQSKTKRKTKRRVAKLLSSLLASLRQSQKEMDHVGGLRSWPEVVYPKAPFPSPMTPAYVKLNADAAAAATQEGLYQDEVDDACRSFENYLVDMIMEDGKVKDLTDVEELLYCWKNLKCPVFTDLVSRFYGELCKDFYGSYSTQQYK